MRRSRKILLVILVLVLLTQIPFVYRRFELRRLNQNIERLGSERRPIESSGRYTEYKGVVHVHSFLGGHSTGSFSEIISAAQANKLHFVVMTEHVEKDFDTAENTLKGFHGDVLFVNGNEISSSDGERLLVIPGNNKITANAKTTFPELVSSVISNGSLSIGAYPPELKSDDAQYDALEVYNVYTNARDINPVVAAFDALWSHRSYPDLLFATFYNRPDTGLQKWDELLAQRKVSATAGNDAHGNIGVSLVDSSGNSIFGVQLDPYQTSFHLVRMHVLIPPEKELNTATLLEALKQGHSFIGFDIFGDTTGFRFGVESPNQDKIQGDDILFRSGTKLKVVVPLRARIVVYKNGKILLDESGLYEKEFEVTEKGVYRVETYLPELGAVGAKPWIISNPIYVR